MKNKRRRTLAVGAATLLASIFALGACGSSDEAQQAVTGAETLDELYDAAVENGETTVTVYGPAEAQVEGVYKQFSKRFPKIKVTDEFLFGGELEARLQQEQATGNHVGDLVHVDDAIRYHDIMTPIEVVGLDDVPDEIKLYDGKLYVTTRSLFGFAYNADRIDKSDVPTSWADVTDPSFAARMGLSDPTSLAATSTVLYSAHEGGAIDDDWLQSLVDRKPKVYQSTSQMAGALATGEIEFTPVCYYGYLPTFREQGANLGFVTPSDGAALTDTPYGLLDGAPNPTAASLLVSWLLSDEGQAALVEGVSEYGTMPSAPEPEGLPVQSDLNTLPIPDLDQRIAKKEEAASFLGNYF